MAPTFVDLFCGIGGFRIGLEAAGFECVYANDIDADAVETYRNNRSPVATYPVECADIRDVFHHRLGNIPRHHVLAAGFPCNPFATQGKMLGEKCEEYGDLGGYVVKIAAAKRPVAVLLENVEMFFHLGKPWYRNLDDAFKKAGYICRYDILLAWEFGLPQHRRRGFIVAIREDVYGVPFEFPPIPYDKRVTIRELLLDSDFAGLRDFTKLKEKHVDIEWRRTRSPGPAWGDIVHDVPNTFRTHTGIMHLGAVKNPHTRAGGQLYHDLGHHPCITTSSRLRSLWFLTPGTDDEGPVARKLHMRELCRIQGFPDSFELPHTSYIAKIKQLSNSVPPPMVEWVGRAVAEQYRAAFVDENDDDGDDEDDESDKETKTTKTGKSRRKSRQRSRHKSQQHSKRRSKHRSKPRSRRNSGEKPKDKSSESSKSSSESSRKRKLSSASDTPPPPKRQHRKHTTSPDGEAESSVRMAGFDGNVEEWVNGTIT